MSIETYQRQTGGDFMVHKNPQSMRRMKSSVVRVPAGYTGRSNLQDPAGYPVRKINDNLYELLLAGEEIDCDGFLIQGPTIVHKTGGDVTPASRPYMILDTNENAQAVCNENKIPVDLNGDEFDIGFIKGTKPEIKWVTDPQTEPIIPTYTQIYRLIDGDTLNPDLYYRGYTDESGSGTRTVPVDN